MMNYAFKNEEMCIENDESSRYEEYDPAHKALRGRAGPENRWVLIEN